MYMNEIARLRTKHRLQDLCVAVFRALALVEEVPRDYPRPTVMLEKFLKEGSVPVAEDFDARVSRYKQVMMEIVIPEMDPLDTERILAMRRIGGEIGRILTRYKASVRHVTAWRGGQGICKGDERTLLPIR
jgi:hypothetical protein